MASGLRWLSIVFAGALSFALASCDLNPQPEVPGADETSSGGSAGVGGDNGVVAGGGAAGSDFHGDPTRLSNDDDPNADENGFSNKNNTGNYEGPETHDRPTPATPPGGQRPVADAGPDALPPVVAM